MRTWAILLGGLLVWAGHFFALYGIGEFAGESAASRGAVLLITASGLAVDAVLAWRLRPVCSAGEFIRWRARGALGGLALRGPGIVLDATPAVQIGRT